MEQALEEQRALINHGWVEIRAVISVNGNETDVHMSNYDDPTWLIGLCDQQTKDAVLPVVRIIYDAVFGERRYR